MYQENLDNDIYQSDNDIYQNNNDIYQLDNDIYQDNNGMYQDDNNIYQNDNDIYQDDNDMYQNDNDMYYPPVDNYDWSPNLFAKLTSLLQTSTSPDVIRMGIIAGIRNSVSTEETPTRWDKVEAMRRYVDSVNQGLGLPEDPKLMSLLHSTQWMGYGLFSMNFISEKNLDFKGICMDEQTSLSYASMVFLIALVKGMSMLNLKHPSPNSEDRQIYTFLIPSQFSTFAFASFLNVANNRLSNKEEISQQDIDELANLAFKSRYWKQGTCLMGKDSEQFVNVLKNIILDILGLTLNVDMNSFSQHAKKEERIADKPKQVLSTENMEANTKLSIVKAVEIVLTGCSVPIDRDQLFSDIQELRPSTNEDSFRAMITKMHREGAISYFNGNLIGFSGRSYGRGYKKVNRYKKK